MVATRIILNQHYNGSPLEFVSTSSDAKPSKRRRVASAPSDDTTLEDSPGGSFESEKSPTSMLSPDGTNSELEDFPGGYFEYKKFPMSSKLLEPKSEISDVIGSTQSLKDETLGRSVVTSSSEYPRPASSSSITSSTPSKFANVSFSAFGGYTSSAYPGSMNFFDSGFVPSSFYGFSPTFGYNATTSSVYNRFMNFGSRWSRVADTTGVTNGFMNSGAATSSDHQNLQNYGCMPSEEAKPGEILEN
ncbi:unnamed protein product [Caenorhabditis brenneri]